MTAKRSGEFAWIAEHFAPLAGEGAFGLMDDAALLQTDGPIVLTHDTIVEGVHFFADDPPGDVARKAVRVNVSDIISKGALPQAMLLALGVPDRWTDPEVAAFAAGLRDDLGTYGLNLLGGDTTRSPERLTVGVTMVGTPLAGRYVSRAGATCGDVVAVSGPIGDAALGLALRRGELEGVGAPVAETLMQRQRVPDPSLADAEIVSRFASAAMDVSDGLIGDAEKLAAASRVGIEIDLDMVPRSSAASFVRSLPRATADRIAITLVTGGDDYVVLLTLGEEEFERARDFVGGRRPGLHRIGTVTAGPVGVVVKKDAVPVTIGRTSYTHD